MKFLKTENLLDLGRIKTEIDISDFETARKFMDAKFYARPGAVKLETIDPKKLTIYNRRGEILLQLKAL